MDRRNAVWFAVFILMIMVSSSTGYQQFGPQIDSDEFNKRFGASYSPFSTALATLQKQIKYTFNNINLLRRSMTHASFSEENNRALSILGMSIIETSASLRYLQNDIDMSSKALNHKIQEVCNVESSCAAEGMHLGLHKVIRVSHNTNSSTPAIVCGAFRAMFGAIALDSGKSDDAGNVFWNVHTRTGGSTAAL